MSSPSVTPRRRRRDEVVDDAVDDEAYSAGSKKRTRLHDHSEEGSQSPDEPLLPDNYRRSPKGKEQRQSTRKHQPGSIVRVTLTNFVTYTKAEFNPGPNLNMIIGPNGTGKSTLVCAICLGLGWSPNHLGRAKDSGEFVKHGADTAVIEIELAANPKKHAENPVVTTKITRAGNKTEFMLNRRKATKKEVEKLMRSFSIQVDNLCQFLPQDRVVEFAALSPVNLLAHTQRAAAPPQMSDWHEHLKGMRKEQKAKQSEQQTLIDDVKSKEHRQKAQQHQVEQLRARSELQARINALEKLRPFPQYRAAKDRYTEAKAHKKHAEKELARLQRQVEPNLQAERAKEAYFQQVEAVALKRGKLLERSDAEAKKRLDELTVTDGAISDKIKQSEAAKDACKNAKSNLPQLQRNKTHIERAMENPPAEADVAAYNDQIREKMRDVRDRNDKMDELKQEVASLQQRGQQQQNILDDAQREKDSLHTQAGQQASKLRTASRQAYQAYQWIQNNRNRFSGDVYGPPAVELAAKDVRHAAAIESAIGQGEMLAFTVTSQADFNTLSDELYKHQGLSDISIRVSGRPLDQYRPPCSNEQLQSYGLQAWMVDLVEGPDAVLAMLCDNRSLAATAFTTRELTNAQLEALKAPNSPITSWITPTEQYIVTRRREYGAAGFSVRNTNLRAARFFTDATVPHNEDAELDQRVIAARREIAELERRRQALKDEYKEVHEQCEAFRREEKAIKDEKAQKQQAIAVFNALPTRLNGAVKKLDEAMAIINSTADAERVIGDEIDKLTLEKGQKAIEFALTVHALRDLNVQHIEIQILAIEAKSDHEQLRARTVEERKMLDVQEREVARLTQEAAALLAEGRRLQAVCTALNDTLDDQELTVCDEIKEWTMDQMDTEISSVQARLDMTGDGGNQHVLKEYEERARKIEKARSKLADIEAELERVDGQIAEIRTQWEPQLDELIAQISEAFADNFSKIQCAGEVAVYKDEDFEQWAIQIKVKFRENEPLSLLDSHRQSGGERAVSTIFYLMALQSLARAPFRVVDEINQGMDPRNERLVHSRMVDIACNEESASQYFLITPKLLNGLRYHESMKVHCIASGEYMPDDYRQMDFGTLARRAVALRAGG
ncbi:hypothetical protein BAUCODRAFT_123954 [Baudoinia panamericana UAMH 10762]|uniref:Structural maintenance of chromosomes protein 5 n=1 Tax=Baudoinia panamericana (strain UAMH 10762) TaxID=717646 RepID=M2N5J1_BAUPA|nr:uncharacterized protein BAUCODRAFT_123954 [Baudoinia panamericana UAMH 10762]EMC94314.1 hypothetical protein BAUCODRAFT_123954 [Baudoinia panamericana UAMH 10762]